MKNYEIKQAFKNLPNAGVPDNEQVACCEYEQCEGCNLNCPRASHIFIIAVDAAGFFLKMNIRYQNILLHGLAHIIDRESCGAYGSQSLHLHARMPRA